MVVRSLVAVLIASLYGAPAASAELVMVRVVGDNVTVKTRPSRVAETLAKPQADTILEVLSREGSWFWVLVERDTHGTQRAGWVRESDVEFVDSAVARFFPAPLPPPAREEPALEEVAADAAAPVDAAAEPVLTDAALAESAEAAAAASAAEAKLKADEKPVAEAQVAQVAKAEKPRKVDDRKLRKAMQEYEKALQAYEKLQFQAVTVEQAFSPVGEPIVEPLYSLPD